jgi:hypothetical protein
VRRNEAVEPRPGIGGARKEFASLGGMGWTHEKIVTRGKGDRGIGMTFGMLRQPLVFSTPTRSIGMTAQLLVDFVCAVKHSRLAREGRQCLPCSADLQHFLAPG